MKMSLRRYFWSQRIIHRTIALVKSGKPTENSDHILGDNLRGEKKREENHNGERIRKGLIVHPSQSGAVESFSWGEMMPELLEDILQLVEAGGDKWADRRNVVACAGVCKQWREAAKEAVEKASVLQPGKITFPSSLKKPGPCDSPVQCLIKHAKKNSTFCLYLSQSHSLTEKGKFLLAARRYKTGVHMEYIISLDPSDFSPGSKAYVGKLRSDFLGTNFTIYDSQSPYNGAKALSNRTGRRFASKQISPQVPASNFEVGHIAYKFNLLKSRGPRRMVCQVQCPSSGNATNGKDQEDLEIESPGPDFVTLKNKTPRWHENLQCWCLNFHGRVTVASVKNFQLAAAVDQSAPGGKGDEETVMLQFGKVRDDSFTMDYRHPLSPFLAFAICLTSFGTKLACE